MRIVKCANLRKKKKIYIYYIYNDIDTILCNDVRFRIYIDSKSKDFYQC